MSEPKRTGRGSPLVAVGGAVLATVIATVVAVAFLHWRTLEQRRVLDERARLCRQRDAHACDWLRNACLKRSSDGCRLLAEAYLTPGANRDPHEGLRLLGEACTYGAADACRHAGAAHAVGRETPRDVAQARRLLERGCRLGDRAACDEAAALPK